MRTIAFACLLCLAAAPSLAQSNYEHVGDGVYYDHTNQRYVRLGPPDEEVRRQERLREDRNEPAGYINPHNGQYYPSVGPGLAINPQTGRVVPVTR